MGSKSSRPSARDTANVPSVIAEPVVGAASPSPVIAVPVGDGGGGGGGGSLVQRLTELKEAQQAGLLSQDEYDTLRSRILAGMTEEVPGAGGVSGGVAALSTDRKAKDMEAFITSSLSSGARLRYAMLENPHWPPGGSIVFTPDHRCMAEDNGDNSATNGGAWECSGDKLTIKWDAWSERRFVSKDQGQTIRNTTGHLTVLGKPRVEATTPPVAAPTMAYKLVQSVPSDLRYGCMVHLRCGKQYLGVTGSGRWGGVIKYHSSTSDDSTIWQLAPATFEPSDDDRVGNIIPKVHTTPHHTSPQLNTQPCSCRPTDA